MRFLGRIMLAAFGCVLVAQYLGYKVFGNTTVVENRPLLRQAWIVERLELPNIAVTTDDRRVPIPGIVFREEAILLEGKALPRLFNEIDPLRIMPDPAQPSGIASERRIVYWSDKLEPRFFPGRVPKYRIDDFGTFIRDRGLHDPGKSAP